MIQFKKGLNSDQPVLTSSINQTLNKAEDFHHHDHGHDHGHGVEDNFENQILRSKVYSKKNRL